MMNRTLTFGIGLLCLAAALAGCSQTASAKAKKAEYEEAKRQYLAAGWPWESNFRGLEGDLFSPSKEPAIARVPNLPERKAPGTLEGAELTNALKWVKESETALDANLAEIRFRMADRVKGPSKGDFPGRAQERFLVKALMFRAEARAVTGESAKAMEDLTAAANIAHWQLVDYKDSIGYMVGVASFSIFARGLERFPAETLDFAKVAALAEKLDSTAAVQSLLTETASYTIDLIRFDEIQSGAVKIPKDLDKLSAELVTDKGEKDAALMMNVWVNIRKIIDKHGANTRLIKEEIKPFLSEMSKAAVKDREALSEQAEMVISMCDMAMKAKASTRAFHAAALLTAMPKGSKLNNLPRQDWSDPFTGNTLSVKWNGDKVTVQSVGPNETDDSTQTGRTDDIRYTLARNQAN